VVISGANISPDGLRAGEIDAMRAAVRDAPISQLTIDDKLNTLWLTSPTKSELSVGVLSHIQQPVLVMSGDHDVIRLEHTLQIYRALPHAELYILPDTQHGTFAERPQWINPVLQWFLNADQTTVASST
jgi:pimeloyl-ACP methyl ester carboxylesterase